jgi:hypothetical protein
VVIDTNKIEMDEDEAIPAGGMQDKSKNLFDRLFGNAKKDSINRVSPTADTVKTKKQQRLDRRAQRRKEKEGGA